MNKQRINEIKSLLNTVPQSPWCYFEGNDFDHWEIYSSRDCVSMVQDDAGVPPDQDFINFILQSRQIIEELLNEIEKNELMKCFDEEK